MRRTHNFVAPLGMMEYLRPGDPDKVQTSESGSRTGSGALPRLSISVALMNSPIQDKASLTDPFASVLQNAAAIFIK